MRLLLDPGEAMLCEEYTYPHIAESMVQPQGFVAIPLAMDAEGIVPCSLRTTLQSLRDAGRPLPRLLTQFQWARTPQVRLPVGDMHSASLKHEADAVIADCLFVYGSPTLQISLPGLLTNGCMKTLAWLSQSHLSLSAGAITPLGRRREIYSICTDYNILILEDDPYYYLQFSTAHGGEPKGLNDLGCSYLSMDTDSRVIRLDSFSKVRQP